MRVADLVDLEWLLRDRGEERGPGSDADGPAGEGRADARRAEIERGRDAVRRALEDAGVPAGEARARVAGDRALRESLLTAWVGAERIERSGDLPGERVESALSLLRLGFVVLGLCVGTGAASALLAYDGSTPVNVLWFVAILFGLQIVSLVLSFLVAPLLGRLRSPGGSGGLLQSGLRSLVRRLLGGRGRKLAAIASAMRTRNRLYATIERWTLFAIWQRFGVALNVGALTTCLFLVTFSDLVFGWSTTLQLDSRDVHAIVSGMAMPWAWLGDAFVPSEAIVAASRWSRMDGAFVGGVADASTLASQWWRFLVAGLCCYGFVPRSLALWYGAHQARRGLRALRLDHAAVEQAFDALLPIGAGWDAPAPDAVRGPAPAGSGRPAGPVEVAAGVPTAVVCWGSVARAGQAVVDAVAARFGLAVAARVDAGGAELDGDERALAVVRSAGAERALLLLDAGQQPTKDALRFVGALRTALGDNVGIAVLLVERGAGGQLADADADERAAWRRSLTTLDDAWVGVATLVPGGGAA
ncbi:MAG: DUF2868 domain-containing protein [Planctomycetes bacterium]|nr:DUF2868 domain-containing protein [Planctomycetota bacterium]